MPKTVPDVESEQQLQAGTAYPLTEYTKKRKRKKRGPIGFAPPKRKR